MNGEDKQRLSELKQRVEKGDRFIIQEFGIDYFNANQGDLSFLMRMYRAKEQNERELRERLGENT